MYLTFDDGPMPGPTEFVLESLDRHHAKATFFCIGDNVKKHPKQYQQIQGQGHAIGNHTFNHLNGWRTQDADYLTNIQKCAEVTERTTLFRPPFGKIRRSQIRRLKDYRIIMWDVLTYDYSAGMSPKRCLSGSMAATRPGSIVVFHDSLKAERNLTAVLPEYLKRLSAQGFEFKALSEGLFANR